MEVPAATGVWHALDFDWSARRHWTNRTEDDRPSVGTQERFRRLRSRHVAGDQARAADRSNQHGEIRQGSDRDEVVDRGASVGNDNGVEEPAFLSVPVKQVQGRRARSRCDRRPHRRDRDPILQRRGRWLHCHLEGHRGLGGSSNARPHQKSTSQQLALVGGWVAARNRRPTSVSLGMTTPFGPTVIIRTGPTPDRLVDLRSGR
jgi:hypothetical protein